MFSLSLFVCKRAVCRRTFRLMCNGLAQSQTTVLRNSLFDSGLPEIELDVSRLGIGFTTKYLNELGDVEDVDWDDLTRKLEEMRIQNPSTKILQACIRLEKVDLGLSYYNYVLKKGKGLSSLDLMFFSKLLANNTKEIQKHEKLIVDLYNEIKEFVHTSSFIRLFIMEAFVHIPACFEDIVKRGRDKKLTGGYMSVVEKALELKRLDVAFEFMKDSEFTTNTSFLENYINVCIQRAKEGTFSVDLINRLINMCREKAIVFKHENLIAPLTALVEALNQYVDDYVWSVSQCDLSENDECSDCGVSLLPMPITDEEFKALKEQLYKLYFVDSNVYLSSTKSELENFLKFLKRASSYNLVLDGLNLLYRNKQAGIQLNNRYLKYFLDKGFRVLTIARRHSKKTIAEGDFLNLKRYKSRAKFFFTSNTSDDDLFLLFATLHGGPQTFFVSGDFLTTYMSRLDDEMKCIFLKWQSSHQYLVTPKRDLMPPMSHCGLPQLTLATKNQYIWHLSHQASPKIKVSFGSDINWFCLRARKKSESEGVTRKNFSKRKS